MLFVPEIEEFGVVGEEEELHPGQRFGLSFGLTLLFLFKLLPFPALLLVVYRVPAALLAPEF